MNISTDKEIGITEKKFTLSDQGSPYLSPLHGLSQPSEQFHEDYLPNLDIDPSFPKSDVSDMAGQFGFDEVSYENQSLFKYEIKHNGNTLYDSKKIEQADVIRVIQQQQSEPKAEKQSLQPKNVISLINFLVYHSSLQEAQVTGYSEYFSGGSEQLKDVFYILAGKFRKLRKTKEQMTKYCMRKAFKFISEYKNAIKKNNARTQTENTISKINYEIPFKKNSQEKTMNSQFLKQTFSREEFVVGYQQFLKQIHQFIDQDNVLKINALAESIQKSLQTKQMEKIRKWNRLPWTSKILQKTEKLAKSLLEYSHLSNDRQHKQNSQQNISQEL